MFKRILFPISALMVLFSSATYLIKWDATPYIFAVGAAGVAVAHLTNRYSGTNLRKKRLNGILGLAGLILVLASFLMFKGMSEWIICLLISAVLHLYVSFTMPSDN
ncbi:MAG: hypothetical protein ACRC6R_01055 [Bacteroidales bacterium]